MAKKFYKRDNRSPIPKNEVISKVMSANKATNTEPELLFRKALQKKELRGYRINYKGVSGTPDICYISKKIAIFINGCFWHRCPYCNLSVPKTNQEFWENKFNRNKQRDIEKVNELKNRGYTVFVFWECQIKSILDNLVKQVKACLDSKK